MAKAVLVVCPEPKVGPDAFHIEVKPAGNTDATGEGMTFVSGLALKEFLGHIEGAANLTGMWGQQINRREPFVILSTYEEWRSLEAWALENMQSHAAPAASRNPVFFGNVEALAGSAGTEILAPES